VDIFTKELSDNPALSLLFVNDGSSDNTLKVIQEICVSYPERASYLSLDKNMGKGEAVRAGMSYLLKESSCNLIGFWDADLAVPLSEVRDFVDIFRSNPGAKAVIGSRVRLAGRPIEYEKLRHHLGRVIATIMCWTFHFKVYDTQCGAKMFDREVLFPIVGKAFCSKWIFDVEMIVRLTHLPSLKNRDNWLYEVPVKEWKNVSGTKRNISAYVGGSVDYFKLVRKYFF
jgi:glycosyltransferase involved in cell wall biosynthesis